MSTASSPTLCPSRSGWRRGPRAARDLPAPRRCARRRARRAVPLACAVAPGLVDHAAERRGCAPPGSLGSLAAVCSLRHRSRAPRPRPRACGPGVGCPRSRRGGDRCRALPHVVARGALALTVATVAAWAGLAAARASRCSPVLAAAAPALAFAVPRRADVGPHRGARASRGRPWLIGLGVSSRCSPAGQHAAADRRAARGDRRPRGCPGVVARSSVSAATARDALVTQWTVPSRCHRPPSRSAHGDRLGQPLGAVGAGRGGMGRPSRRRLGSRVVRRHAPALPHRRGLGYARLEPAAGPHGRARHVRRAARHRRRGSPRMGGRRAPASAGPRRGRDLGAALLGVAPGGWRSPWSSRLSVVRVTLRAGATGVLEPGRSGRPARAPRGGFPDPDPAATGALVVLAVAGGVLAPPRRRRLPAWSTPSARTPRTSWPSRSTQRSAARRCRRPPRPTSTRERGGAACLAASRSAAGDVERALLLVAVPPRALGPWPSSPSSPRLAARRLARRPSARCTRPHDTSAARSPARRVFLARPRSRRRQPHALRRRSGRRRAATRRGSSREVRPAAC